MKKKLDIIYEDKDIIIVYKKYGLLTVANVKENVNTLYHEVYDYLHKKNQRVFIVHRLDKDTSGLVLFAKSEQSKIFLQNNWESFTRKYYAICKGYFSNKKGCLSSYLYEDKTHFVRKTDNKKLGKLAITNYEVIKENNDYSLLDIDIKTGRKNQIRVQLNDASHPIIGDKKYAKNEKSIIQRLALEAYYLRIIHPKTKKWLEFKIDLNKDFQRLFF